MFENVKTIFIDYDGTIHNSIKIYGPAFRKAYKYLVEEGVSPYKVWNDSEISYWLGFNSKAMWKNFMPSLDPHIRDKASKIIGREMLSQIRAGKSVLYDDALDTLKYLKQKGYHLIFLSNCSISYRDMAKDKFKLGDYFEKMACSEEYGYIPKHKILSKLKHKYPQGMVIIGDRFQDIEAGKKNEILTIGCNYGFQQPGELNDADITIDSIKEIMNIL
ncbi:MAG: HAD family hydrolase [Senegalia sp. (in: firmicutes)]|uniref:HAD family hydrolase n=1 Tax=Senegalia sp. (in: firmicutes) TaxID=1924098 RepID=UPI003F99BCCE